MKLTGKLKSEDDQEFYQVWGEYQENLEKRKNQKNVIDPEYRSLDHKIGLWHNKRIDNNVKQEDLKQYYEEANQIIKTLRDNGQVRYDNINGNTIALLRDIAEETGWNKEDELEEKFEILCNKATKRFEYETRKTKNELSNELNNI